MSTTNYDGRTLDLCILGGLSYAAGTREEVHSTLDLAIGGQVCAGVVKLMQKVLVLMLTYSHRYDPDWGTSLPEVISEGSLSRVASRLEQRLPEIMEDVTATLRAQEFIDTPLDERIDSITREGDISVNYDELSVSVQLRVITLNGSSTTIIVPLKTKL